MSTLPQAIVCLTGSELTRGETHDRNGPFLGTELTLAGAEVREIRLVPDDPAEMARVFQDAVDHADVVLVSGGLGPTADDHTVSVAARLLQRGVRRDPEALSRMRERALRRMGREDRIPENYYKQAEVVDGARVLLNPVGLAPGSLIETPRGFLALLPGVPQELRAMFRELVLPEIRSRFGLAAPRLVRAKILGHGESWAEARIQKLGIDFSRVEYGISAKPGELLVKFLARDPEGFAYLEEVRALLEKEFGEDLLPLPEGVVTESGEGAGGEHSRIVHELLLRAQCTLATAESCTGGLLAKRLTDHPGSSAYFLGSVVAYDNAVKRDVLAVDPEILEKKGAVSAEVCRAMALGARRLFRSDYALAVTGIAGPGGGSPEKPVGLVYIGLAGPGAGGEPELIAERQHFWGSRQNVRLLAAVRALDWVRRVLSRR